MRSARVARASSGVAPELLSDTISGRLAGCSSAGEVLGATPKTTRRRHVLPKPIPASTLAFGIFAKLFCHFSPRHYVYVNGEAISTMNKMKLIRKFAKNRLWPGRQPLLARALQLLWAAALVLPAFAARADVVFTNLYSFTGTNDGADPHAALVQGDDGYFYGTTYGGGAYTNQFGQGYGTVFKINTNGVLTSLYSFTGSNDGSNPNGMVQGKDGYFYGTTESGGPYTNQFGEGCGTVFKLSSNGVLTNLYSFGLIHDIHGTPLDGANPQTALVQGSDGNFYGTTASGGSTNYNYNNFGGYGTVFKISTNGTFTSLYAFGSIQDTNGNPLDGANPQASLAQGRDGYFYGTTYYGGTNDAGTVFKISTNGVMNTLYSFTGGNDGDGPNGLVQGGDGYFYGTTQSGGINGGGTVFKINPSGAFTSLHSFPVFSGDGFLEYPSPGGLVQGSDGYFYGTTGFVGGSLHPLGSCSIFQISSDGAFTSLYLFGGGGRFTMNAKGGLVQGSDGSFYGTTISGSGTSIFGSGTIFRLTIVPELQAMTLTNGSLNLTWSTEAGEIYQLQSSASLNTPNWTNLGSPVTATGGTLTFTDSITNAPQRFYRLSLAP